MNNLRFEKFQEKHIDTYYSWRNDPTVAIYDQSGFLRPMGYEEVKEWCDVMINGLTFVAYDGDTPLGTCAFMNLNQKNRHAELAIVIGNKDYWSKGYGTKIMDQLLDWGFNDLNLNKLYLHVFANNPRAIGLYEKMGFVKEGTLREMLYRNGEYVDVYSYGLLQREYLENKNANQ